MAQNATQDSSSKNTTMISRRAVLNACVATGLLPAMPRIGWSAPPSAKDVTPKKLGVTARARKEVLKRAFAQMQFLHVLYGLDKDEPVVLRDGVAYVKCKDPLGVLPAVTEIKSAFAGDTKIGQLHAMMTAVYAALHGEGKYGKKNRDAEIGAEHDYGNTADVVGAAKASIIKLMKMQAGLIPGDQGTYQKEVESFKASIALLPRMRVMATFREALGATYSTNANKRIGLGLQSFLDFLASNPSSLRTAKAEKIISEFEASFIKYLEPETNSRVLKFYFKPKNKESKFRFSDSYGYAPWFGINASFNSFRVLFPNVALPSISAWIPFKDSAMPEYQIWYADQQKEFSIPLYRAFNTSQFQTKIPNLSRETTFDISKFLPADFSFRQGAISAFNLSVGLSDFGTKFRLDRTTDLKKEAVKRGVTVSSRESEDRDGLLLTTYIGNENDQKWGAEIWPKRNVL